MRRQAILVTVLFMTAAALPAIGANLGEETATTPGHSACLPGDVVDNDDLRIWFHGAKFQLKVFKKNESTNGIDGKYQYKSMDIVELDDANETVAELKLENAEPQSSSCEVERSGEWINVTYTAVEDVRTPADDGPDTGQAQVAFVYHFNTSDDSAKFDLNVQDWPWQDDTDNELAYSFDVTSDWEIEPAENGLGFRDGDSGEAEAFIEWAPNATAYYEDGHEEEAIVDSSTSGSDHHTTTQLRFTNVTAGYVELDYDPEVAVGPYIIVADILIPLADVPTLLREPIQDLV